MEMNTNAWKEYESAAEWCAARGILGAMGDTLPRNLSPQALEMVNLDPEAFENRVRECAYARSMANPKGSHE